MPDRKIDKKLIKQVVIDEQMHRLLKIVATKRQMSIKSLLEASIADVIQEETIQNKS